MKLEEIGSYWNTRAEGYSQSIQEELNHGSAARFTDIFRSLIKEGTQPECLDVGCGPAFFSILLNRLGGRITSVDYSEEMLAQAEANLRNAGFTPRMLRGDAQELPFEDEKFDLIVSRNLVWNLEKPEQAYREWLRLLKPGGKLFVADGNHYLYYYDEAYRLARQEREKLHRELDHTRGVDPTPINEIARDLPLSKCLRPDWDLNTLRKLGCRNLTADIHTHSFIRPDNGEEVQLIDSFEIRGEK